MVHPLPVTGGNSFPSGDYMVMDPSGPLKDRNYSQLMSSLYNSLIFLYGPHAHMLHMPHMASLYFHDFAKNI